jgi:hypothetical protein
VTALTRPPRLSAHARARGPRVSIAAVRDRHGVGGGVGRRGRRGGRRAEDLLQDPRGAAQAAVREDALPRRRALQPQRQDRLPGSNGAVVRG